MAFETITGAVASTGTVVGGELTNKYSNFLNGGGSEVATIYDDDIWIVDPSVNTKRVRIDAGNLSSSTDVVLYAKSDNDVNLGSVGTHEIYIPAGAMYTPTTNGAAYTTRELATNDIQIASMNFDTSTSEKAQFNWLTPPNWDAGTIRFKVIWTCTGGGAAETIDFDLAGGSYTDNDALDAALGSAQSVTDTRLADDDLHETSFSSAITIGGSPAAGHFVVFQLSRDVASDNLAVDCEIIGVTIEYSTSKSNTT